MSPVGLPTRPLRLEGDACLRRAGTSPWLEESAPSQTLALVTQGVGGEEGDTGFSFAETQGAGEERSPGSCPHPKAPAVLVTGHSAVG